MAIGRGGGREREDVAERRKGNEWERRACPVARVAKQERDGIRVSEEGGRETQRSRNKERRERWRYAGGGQTERR